MADYFYGETEDLRVGRVYANRKALMEAGVHLSPRAGIDGSAQDGAASIVLNGGYEDKDYNDTIDYTGHGGYDAKTGKQIKDQSWNSCGNKALLKSERNRKPVRVFRGSKHISAYSPEKGYAYGGLYYVVKHYQTRSNGYLICRFTLKKEKPMQEEKVPVSTTVSVEEEPLAAPVFSSVGEPSEVDTKEKISYSFSNEQSGNTAVAPKGFLGGLFNFLRRLYRKITSSC